MPRLSIEARRAKVFEMVVAGAKDPAICKKLRISQDTLARDMVEIGELVQQLVRERHGEILAEVLAHYRWVLHTARGEYERDLKREQEWWDGKLDIPTLERTTKTLEAEPAGLPDPDATDLGSIGAFIGSLDADVGETSDALEVITKTGSVRPAWRSQRATWLKLVLDATREIAQLCGLQKIVVEHQHSGTVNQTVTIEDLRTKSDDELRQLLGDSGGGTTGTRSA